MTSATYIPTAAKHTQMLAFTPCGGTQLKSSISCWKVTEIGGILLLLLDWIK